MTREYPERTCKKCGGHRFYASLDNRYQEGFRLRCADCRNRRSRAHWNKTPALLDYHRKYAREMARKLAPKVRADRQALKRRLIKGYGGACVCCGEQEPDFLTLEHLNNDGAAHRRSLVNPGSRGGRGNWKSWHSATVRVYRDLENRGYPQEGYTLLCWNCHMATRFGVICPHKRANASVA